jgi:hypothetical protein
MIDQLASAIEKALSDALFDLRQNGNGPYPDDFNAAVRAILMAMREPSAEMMAAGGDKSLTDDPICGRLNASAIWKSMIDTILEDEGK